MIELQNHKKEKTSLYNQEEEINLKIQLIDERTSHIKNFVQSDQRSRLKFIQILVGPTILTTALQLLLPIVLMLIWRLYDIMSDGQVCHLLILFYFH